jgi:hypothetical protein
MGKVTIGPQNSSMKSISYKSEPIVSIAPVELSLTAPMQPYIEVIKEVHIPVETIKYIDKIQYIDKIVEVLSEPIIIEKIIEVPKEVIKEVMVEKIIEVPNYDLYDGAVIQLDILRRQHRKLKKQIKILIPILAVVALIGHFILRR